MVGQTYFRGYHCHLDKQNQPTRTERFKCSDEGPKIAILGEINEHQENTGK